MRARTYITDATDDLPTMVHWPSWIHSFRGWQKMRPICGSDLPHSARRIHSSRDWNRSRQSVRLIWSTVVQGFIGKSINSILFDRVNVVWFSVVGKHKSYENLKETLWTCNLLVNKLQLFKHFLKFFLPMCVNLIVPGEIKSNST